MRPPAGANVTKVYHKIMKWLPMVLSDHTGNIELSMDGTTHVWTHTKKQKKKNIVCRMEATGAVQASTIFTLLAFVTSIQKGDGEISINDTTVTLTVKNYRTWIMKYLNHRNYEEFHEDLRRLISYKIFWIQPDGKFTTQSYVYDGEMQDDYFTVILKRSFVDSCISRGLGIEFFKMQERLNKKPTAKLLYMYLCSNSASNYHEATLMERIELTNEVRNNRITLKNAFRDLKTATLIGSWQYDDKSRKFYFTAPEQDDKDGQEQKAC